VAKKSKGEKKADKQAKDVKKLRKTVEELQSQNEDLAKTVKKLRKSQEKSREELENIVRDLEARIESPGVETPVEDDAPSVTVGADGSIVSGDDEIGGDGGGIEVSSDTPTVSADDGISSGAPKASAKATESAKRKAEELGVDLSGVEGTGSRNRVTVADVEKAARKE
jgi:pyruvate/2-oxoglutarate dehydrogenase complex dihydrolipoamide acyltransferase (E2) component